LKGYGYVIANNEVTIINYSGSDKNVTIPSEIEGLSVNRIGQYAFYGHRLEVVTIPDTVTSIEKGAFMLNRLSEIIIPDSVTHIGHGAFAGNKLTTVIILNSVTHIEREAFWNNPLSRITIEDIEIPLELPEENWIEYYVSEETRASELRTAIGVGELLD